MYSIIHSPLEAITPRRYSVKWVKPVLSVRRAKRTNLPLSPSVRGTGGGSVFVCSNLWLIYILRALCVFVVSYNVYTSVPPYYYPSTSCFLCSFFKMHNRKALIR